MTQLPAGTVTFLFTDMLGWQLEHVRRLAVPLGETASLVPGRC